MLKITLVKSYIGFTVRQRATVFALGLNKIGSAAVHAETPAVLGMIRKVNHLLKVEKINEAEVA